MIFLLISIVFSIVPHFVFMEIIGGKNFNDSLISSCLLSSCQQMLAACKYRIFRAGKDFRVVLIIYVLSCFPSWQLECMLKVSRYQWTCLFVLLCMIVFISFLYNKLSVELIELNSVTLSNSQAWVLYYWSHITQVQCPF